MNSYIAAIEADGVAHYYSRLARPFAGTQTQPYLKEVSNLTRALHLEHTQENSKVTVTLHNPGDKFLSTVDLSEAGLKLYYETADTVVFTGQVCDTPESQPGELTIKADIFSLLNHEISPTLENPPFGNLPAENNRKHGTIMLGTADDADLTQPKGVCPALRINLGQKFLANWLTMSLLTGVYDRNGSDITSEAQLIFEMDGLSFIKLDNATSDLVIYYNGKGPESGGELIDNPADMLALLIDSYSTLTVDADSIAAAAAVFAERGYEGNLVVIDSDWTWLDLFREIGVSFDCHVFLDRQGQAHMKVLDWGTETAVEKLHPAMFKGFRVDKDIKDVTGRWRGKYRYSFNDRKYHRRLEVDAGNSKERLRKNPQQFVRLETTCLDATGRKAFLYGKELYYYRFALPARQAFALELGDAIEAKHRKNPLGNDYRLIWLLRESVSPKTSFVTFEGLDITDIVKDVFFLYDEDHPDVAVLQDSSGPALL